MFSGNDASASRVAKDLRMVYDVLMVFPYTIVHKRENKVLLTPRGTIKIHESYQAYPILAIFYVKYLTGKFPYEVIPTDLDWPEPYVILNTILMCLKEPSFFANKDKEYFTKRLHDVVAPELTIPESRQDEILGERRRTHPNAIKKISENFTNSPEVRSRVQKFFEKIA